MSSGYPILSRVSRLQSSFRSKVPLEPLKIKDYDPLWPRNYEMERLRIEYAMGHLIKGIEHTGSTSIPGSAAKPVIDIDIVVKNFKTIRPFVEAMQSLDYSHKGSLNIANRQYFSRLGFHVNITTADNDDYLRRKAFAEYLRQNDDARDEYSKLKKDLAIKWFERPNDHIHYNIEKTPLIFSVLEKLGWDRESNLQVLRTRLNWLNKNAGNMRYTSSLLQNDQIEHTGTEMSIQQRAEE